MELNVQRLLALGRVEPANAVPGDVQLPTPDVLHSKNVVHGLPYGEFAGARSFRRTLNAHR